MRKRSAHGFALIDLVFVCGLVGVLCSIAVPRLLLAKDMAGAASAIGSMRSINSAQMSYALTCGSGYYAPNLSTLGQAPAGSTEPFITGGLGDANTVVKSGYVLQLTATPDAAAPRSCNGLAAGQGGAWVSRQRPTRPRWSMSGTSGPTQTPSSTKPPPRCFP